MYKIIFYRDRNGNQPVDDTYILLNHFIKKTQKTPIKEIEKAKRIIKEIKERGI